MWAIRSLSGRHWAAGSQIGEQNEETSHACAGRVGSCRHRRLNGAFAEPGIYIISGGKFEASNEASLG